MAKRKGQGRTSKDHPERSIAFLSQEINNNNMPGMIKCIPKRKCKRFTNQIKYVI